MSGQLILCATPIGNLEDITLRVLRALKEADLIAAEDTRHSRALLAHFDIHTPLTSYHEHNKYEKAEQLVRKMQEGLKIALVTDAGTPAISDPGEVLVAACYEEGIPVTSLPGACACITGLTMSGLSTRRFAFEAFLPPEKKERARILEVLKKETRTIVLYEAPHHLRETLKELLEALGDRPMTLCRELTKKHEEGIRTTLLQALRLYEREEPRGEYVLVVAGRDPAELVEEKQAAFAELSLSAHMELYLQQGMERKEAMRQVAKDRGCSKRDIYNRLLAEEAGEEE